MKFFTLSSCFLFLLSQTVYGFYFGNLLQKEQFNADSKPSDYSEPSTPFKSSDELSSDNSDSLHAYNTTSEYRSEQGYSSTEGSESPPTDTIHFQSTENSITGMKSESVMSTSSNQRLENLSEIFSNETQSNTSVDSSSVSKAESSSSTSSAVTNERVQSSKTSAISNINSGSTTNAPSSVSDDNETEGVVIRKPILNANGTVVTPNDKTLYQRTLELISDTYTLSILVPVAAGVVFATTIILTIAICRCLKRRCRRRQLRRKVLPDSVKNLRPSDRARLLAESSDEEF